ncbi:MAG: condensation domain-containing protein, partial [Pyrinomonadaceae bacterium]
RREMMLEMEGHGREELFEGVDVTRTVGWFTSMYPVRVEVGEEGESVGEELKRVKEELRAVPGRGMGYGLLRYVREAEELKEGRGSEEGGEKRAEELGEGGRAEVSFNYLGQFDQVLGEEGLWQAGAGRAGAVRGAGERRGRLIDINGSVAGGRLEVRWTYGEGVHRRETIERLGEWFAEALREVVRHCREEGAGGYTPSDFPEANLNQTELDELLSQLIES